jgi:hypothetical protein
MKKTLLSLTLVAFLAFSNFVSAQKMLDRGHIKMEIVDVKSDDDQMAMGLEMLKGSQTELLFTPEKSLTLMSMMGGMIEMTNLVDHESNQLDLLFNAMGQKMWIQNEYIDQSDADAAARRENMKFTANKDKTKVIAGYDCYELTVTSPEMGDMKLIAYVTEEIKTKTSTVQGFEGVEFPGFPLEYTVHNPMMALTLRAVSVKDKVDDTRFKLKTAGYQKMTMEEFQNAMGGFGGFGF